MGISQGNKRRFYCSLPVILLVMVAIAGWLATAYLGRMARQQIIGENHATASILFTHISSELTSLEGAVKALAASPALAPALLSKGAQESERANNALDRFNAALKTSVSFLLDTHGVTVASSNRKDPDSFVGESYHFRPYFQAAVQGQAGRYFARGMTSGKMGFYAAYPVADRLGKVIGVAAMKKNLDDLELFFSRFPMCFLINPDGIIFLSSSPAMNLKCLWPLETAVREELIASRQFGDKLPETGFLKKEIADGTEITLAGVDYYVSRRVIDTDRWSIVLMTPTVRIMFYKSFGILATFSVGLLIILFSGIVYFADRSKETIRQSEESKRLLLQAVGDGLIGIDTAGQLTFVNRAALRMLRFSEAEMVGQNAHALIHHSRRNGDSYREEDCPMQASLTRAFDSHVTDEVLWRKDGSSFPVEYFSTPIIKDGRVTGMVVTFRDITERERVATALRESEGKYRSIFDNAPLGLLHFDSNGITTSCNDKFAEIIGSPREALIGLNMLNLPDKHMGKAVERALDGKMGHYDDEYRTFTSNKVIAIHALFTPITSEKGETIGGLGIIEDITDRKQAEKALQESERRFDRLAEQSGTFVWEVDTQGLYTYVSHVAESVLGYHPDELAGRMHFYDLHPESGREAFKKAAFAVFDRQGQFQNLENAAQTKDGRHVWLSTNCIPLLHADGTLRGYHGSNTDISERKRTEEKIRQMAYHDCLTGLPNRKLFSDRLSMALAQFQRNKKGVAVTMLDIDHFKDVNDTLGHDVGDLLLKAAAERLSAALRKGDTVARFGGDEFILILPDLKGTEDAVQVAQKILESFRKPFLIDTHQLTVTTSIGIAVYPQDGEDEVILLKNADIAMYRAKQTGRDRYRIFNEA